MSQREVLAFGWEAGYDPGKLTTSRIKDLFLTTSFVFTFRAGARTE